MEELDIYLLNDQPTTCPKCGARTFFDEFGNGKEMYQLHTCSNHGANFIFIVMDN